MTKKSHKNVVLRAKKVQELTSLHYEPGRQDRCKRWVFRNIVSKAYPISERTFYRYLSMDASGGETQEKQEDKNQMKLF